MLVRKPAESMVLTPRSVTEIIYELIVNNFIQNDPVAQGFAFKQKYNADPALTEIVVGIANRWDAREASIRPAVYVFREDDSISRPTMQQSIHNNVQESETMTLATHTMRCGVAVIATNIGFVEDLAEFVRRPFTYYETEIRDDFKFRRFRLSAISSPKLYHESKDNFIIVMNIETVFDDCVVVKADDLKIKTIGKDLFDAITNKQLS